ncbi:MAG TPA: type II toxin-antitoxin system VapC family toxin [Acidimicrobiales bacterium]|nr:type II toxin-antitoxin system VapC family toxin [Acidimicrobiales bacterium]
MTRAGGPFVVDTSVAMAWVFEDEATPATDALLERLRDGSAVVPSLWRFEVANVLAVAERRGRITEAQSVRFSRLLGALPIDVDDDPATLQELVHTARHHGLSAYDASYLLLALRLGAPLATLDGRLRDAAKTAGVGLVP